MSNATPAYEVTRIPCPNCRNAWLESMQGGHWCDCCQNFVDPDASHFHMYGEYCHAAD